MNKNSDMSDQSFAALMVLLFLVAVGTKYRFGLVEFYFKYRVAIALFLSISIVGIYLRGKELFLKKFEKKFLEDDVLTAKEGEDAIFAGFTKKGKRIDIKHAYRRMHAQVIGTTNAGKT